MPDIKQFEPLWGTWRTEELLGEGSFGKVYRGVREEYDIKYYSAIKHISIPASESQINDAIDEGVASDKASASKYFSDIARSLVSEISLMNEVKGITNIVSYEDHLVVPKSSGVGCDIFIRMELLTALNSVLRTKQLSEDDVIQLGIDICSALEVCAQKGIIHRDIKPANIFINDSGAYKLGDFGVARHLEGTTVGMSKKGTYGYMAPEVYRGEPANATADIYSLGMVMYRLLNGNRAPFLPADNSRISAGQNEAALARRMSGEPLPAPAYASPAMANVICTATQFDRRERYQSATELKTALISLRKASANQQSTAEQTACEPVQYGSPTPFRSTNNYSDNSTVYASEEYRTAAQNQTHVSIKEKAYEPLPPLKETNGAPSKKKRSAVKALSIAAAVILFIAAVLSAVCYFISACGGKAASPKFSPIEDFEFTTFGNEMYVAKYIGNESEVVIPKSVIGITVTKIDSYAFQDCAGITSVTIPDSVTSIGDGAFRSCTSLKSITIPDSVTYIGDGAFVGCDSLENITIPDSTTSIGDYAFECCTSLKSITIPDSVKSIGVGAFYDCTSLKSITIPDSVTNIGNHAFYGCTSLESIDVSSGNPNFCDIDGVLFNKAKTEIIKYPECRIGSSYVIPDSVTSICYGAFSFCTSLESITIPDSVTIIDYEAFFDCTSLESITIPDSVTSIDYWAFYGCTSLESITIPDSVTSIGWEAFQGCTNLKSIIIGNGLTSIGDYAFYDCTITVYAPHEKSYYGGNYLGDNVTWVVQ